MRTLLISGLVVLAIACADVTGTDHAPVHVTLTPLVGSAACFTADPEPASVPQDKGIAFINKSTVSITIMLVGEGGEADVPLVSVAPDDTSSAVKFSSAGLREYYSQACGSGTANRHTLAVTVN
jgi:hypothetical protein